MKLKYFFLAIVLILTVAACKQDDQESSSGISPAIGERMQMASFRMESLTDEKIVDSSQLEGKVLLVSFFASWCPPCIQEIPILIELQETYQAEGFSVVAFSMDKGDIGPLKNLIIKKGINYPVMMADPEVTRSFGGVTGIPVSFLVNRRGEIVKKYLGYVGHDVLEQEIRTLLAAG